LVLGWPVRRLLNEPEFRVDAAGRAGGVDGLGDAEHAIPTMPTRCAVNVSLAPGGDALHARDWLCPLVVLAGYLITSVGPG
jgi:hypothetical protein